MPFEDRQSIWPVWRIAVPILTLLFVLYPAALAISHDRPPIASIAAAEALPVQGSVQETCPPIDRCVNAAVEQALPRLPVPPLLLFALIVVLLAMCWQHRTPTRHRDWWWPPNRRRALLQVFLI